jgi:ankyrin repeat protein
MVVKKIVQGFLNLGVTDADHQALKYAARNGHNEVVKVLLAAPNVDINHAETNGSTALMLAARRGHHEVVKTLLNEGADKTKTNKQGQTAEQLARENVHIYVAEEIAKHQ